MTVGWCSACHGRGIIAVAYWRLDRGVFFEDEPCPTCRPKEAAEAPTSTERRRAEGDPEEQR